VLLFRVQVIVVEEGGVEVKTEVFETPYNLGILRENLGQIIKGRAELPDDVIQRQKLLEETAYDSALARFKHEAEIFQQLSLGGNLNQRNLQAWMWDWHVSTEPLLQERITALVEEEHAAQMKEIEKGKVKGKNGPTPLGHFLQLLPTSKVTLIAILELVNMLVSNGYQEGIRTTRAILTIGAAIEAEHHFQLARKKDIPILDFKSRADLPTYSVAGYLELHKERVKAKLEMEGAENWMPPWTQEVRARVGAFVVDALMENSTVVKSKYIDGELL
jgi:DNA-directed RNA polymerase, mitochondrial